MKQDPMLMSWSLSLEHASPRVSGDWQKMLHEPCELLYKLWGTRHRKTHNLPKTSNEGRGCWEGEQRQESDFSA